MLATLDALYIQVGPIHPALLRGQEGNVSYSTSTIRWAAASILGGGVLYALYGLLYALYGLLNPLLALSLTWFLLGNLLSAALLTAGLTGLRVYLRELGVSLGWVGLVGHWVSIVALAVWTALGLASFLVLALIGPTRLTGLAVDISDFLLVVVFVGSALLGAALYLRTNVVPRGSSSALVIASVLALVPALADYVLALIPIWVFETLRVVYGAAWALVGYGLRARREAVAPPRPRVR
jgi:hypothetical protein